MSFAIVIKIDFKKLSEKKLSKVSDKNYALFFN